MKSRTLVELPNRATAKTVKEEPRRTQLRSERLDPSCRKSSTATLLPKREDA
jgi:hypothetical protein